MVSVVKEGWLYKRGVYIRNWRPRYFQLLDNGILHGYKSGRPDQPGAPGDEALNEFPVANCKVKVADDVKKYAFVVTFLDQTTFVERIFRAESDEDRNQWVESIQSLAATRTVTGAGPAALAQQEVLEGKGNPMQLLSQLDAHVSLDDFDILKVLGKGTFGKVVLAKKKGDTEYVAIKVLKKAVIMEKDEVTHTLTENRVLQKMKHPFLTELKYSFQTEDRLCFVMEFVNGGELFYHLSKDRIFSAERARFYAAEILLALGYLHEFGIIYRDLKLENLLLDRAGHIKVTDFGLCKEDVGFGKTTQTFCGTPEYLAPEVLEDNDYTRAVDWWGLGVVMYEMLCGHLPFYNRNHEVLFELILSEEITYAPHVQAIPHAVELLSGLLCKDPTRRLGAGKRDCEEIKDHSFFASIKFDDLYNKKIPAPFKPQLSSEMDVSYFDTDFTSEPTRLTPTKSALTAEEDRQFSNFNYIPAE